MLSEKFTLLDLTDLALKLPEVGHVNFNILYTVISNIIIKMGLDDVKVPCYIDDEVLAQAAVTKARIEGKIVRRPSKIMSVKEIKEKMKKKEGRAVIEEETSVAQVKEKTKKERRGVTEEETSVAQVEEKMEKEHRVAEEETSVAQVEEKIEKERRGVTEEETSVAQVEEEMKEGYGELSVEEEVRRLTNSVLEKIVEEKTGVAAESSDIKGVAEEASMQIKDVSEKEDQAAAPEKDEKQETGIAERQEAETAETQETEAVAESSNIKGVAEKTYMQIKDVSEEKEEAEASEKDEKQEKEIAERQETEIAETQETDAVAESSDIKGAAEETYVQIKDVSEEEAAAPEKDEKQEIEIAERQETEIAETQETEIAETQETDAVAESSDIKGVAEETYVQIKDVSEEEAAAPEKDEKQEIEIAERQEAEMPETQETEVTDSSDTKVVDEEAKVQIKDTSEEEAVAPEKDEKYVEEKDDVKTIKSVDDDDDDDDREEEEISQEGETESEESEEELDTEKLEVIARDLMEAGAEVMAEKVEAVAEAFKTLRDEDLLDAEEPAKVVEELWRATNINRRMEAAEIGLNNLSEIIDDLLSKIQDLEDETQEILESSRYMLKEIKTFVDRMHNLERMSSELASRIDDSNEKRESEVERLEEIIKVLKMRQEKAESTINIMKQDLEENVAYKSDLDGLKEQIDEDMQANIAGVKKLIREVEDTLVKKEDFQELLSKVEQLEEDKVSRHELGRLLEPGFIDNFLDEQKNLRIELEELKEKVIHLETNLEEVKRFIEEDIIRTMNEKFSEVHLMLDTINAKLALLDPDEINDSFANLEEQVEMILRDLGELKSSFDEFLKEAKSNFKKVFNMNDWLNRLEQTKMDKAKLYELLEMKADIDLIVGKLDRSEFAIVVGNMKDDIDRMSLAVKINEEIMNENFDQVRQELSLTMYKEDFIYGTEPIRNRIKALIYELKRVKEIALTHLFPDAPGIAKCISCKRGAHLAGPKYAGDANVEFAEDAPSGSRVRMAYDKSSKPDTGLSLPPIDLDSVPFPPPDKPRERDPGRLPLLFATARPNVGLTHEVRKSTIDKRLAAYFAKRPVRAIEGEYTGTHPHQRGVPFTSFELTMAEKEEILLKGIDEGIYKGSVPEGFSEKDTEEKDQPKPSVKTSKKNDVVVPTPVSLHVDNEPLQKTKAYPKESRRISFPPNQNNRKSRNKISK